MWILHVELMSLLSGGSSIPGCFNVLHPFKFPGSNLDGCHRQLLAVTTGRYILKLPSYLPRSSTVTVDSFNSVFFVSVSLSFHLGQRAFVGVRNSYGRTSHIGGVPKQLSLDLLEMQYGSQFTELLRGIIGF
jgi:hypothetical protein